MKMTMKNNGNNNNRQIIMIKYRIQKYKKVQATTNAKYIQETTIIVNY